MCRWGAHLKSKLEFEAETEELEAEKRKMIMDRHQKLGTDPSVDIAQLAAWRADREQPCFQESGHALYRRIFLGIGATPSDLFAALVWRGHRELAGDRHLIVLPMGGTLPGSLPWTASQDWLDYHGLDPADAEHVRGLWAEMDVVAAEEQETPK